MDNEKKTPIITRMTPEHELKIIIPECCKRGDPDCPHRAKKEVKKKQNIGL